MRAQTGKIIYSPPHERRTVMSKYARILLLTLLGLSTVFFLWFAQTIPVISDTIGYVYAGERLAAGHGLTFEDPLNEGAGPYFSLYAFQIRRPDDARMFLGYPPGFPILLATAIWLSGQATAVYYIVPLLALLGLAATYVIGSLVGQSEWTGLWAVVILIMSPAFWEYGTSPWSEAPSLALITSAVALYLLSQRYLLRADLLQANEGTFHGRGTLAQRAILCSTLAGLLFVFSFFIRYSNLVLVAPLALYELATARSHIFRDWRRWPILIVLGLGALAIPMFNNFYYGGPTVTSYSPVHGWYPMPVFSLEYALQPPRNGLWQTAKTLWTNFPGFIILLPIGWFLLRWRKAVLVAGMALMTILLYVAYAFPPVGVNSRFLLPAFPFLSVAIAEVIVVAGRQISHEKWRWLAGGFLLALMALMTGFHMQQLQLRDQQNIQHRQYVENMVGFSSENAVFLSYVFNDEIRFYSNRSVLNYRRIPPSDAKAGRYRHEVFEPCLVQTVDRLLTMGIPVYFVEDGSPTFWNSMAVLERNYSMSLANPDFKVHQVSWPAAAVNREGLAVCQP
jgi:4-amino-4-deoxy-L-arabinose transferase-like glycosyltransferase